MAKPNPEILKWARENAGLSLEDAAKKLKLHSKKLSGASILYAYESGEKEPTSKKISDMSKVYHRSILTFYLSNPPKIVSKGEDYRTTPDKCPIEKIGDVDAIARDIFLRKEIIKEALVDSDQARRKDFVGKIKITDDVSEASTFLRNRFNISTNEFRKLTPTHKAMAYLRKQIENEGVFVILIGNLGSHHSRVNTSQFRGFALADEIAPFIVINDNDSKKAQCFTMLHELVHIVIGETGISDSSISHKIEKFCNDVASDLLLSTEEESTIMISNHLTFEEKLSVIEEKSAEFCISKSLIAYRLYRSGKIDYDEWESISLHFKTLWQNHKVKEQKNPKSQPSYYNTRRHKTGSALLKIVKNSILEGVLSHTKAGKVLGVSSGNVARMVEL